MVNMMKLMKQAADMQKNMQKAQAELAQKEFEYTAGGGAVVVKVKGDLSISGIKIDRKVVDPDDVEMLEDLVKAGLEGALRLAKETTSAEMSRLTGGIDLPFGLA